MCAASSRRHKLGEKVVVRVPSVYKPEDCQRLMESAIKFILSGRNVIPYPYKHLSAVVNRPMNVGMTSREISFEQLHKRKAAAMIAKVDGILKGLDKEFNQSSDIQIREVAFIIGPTIHCPKEVYLFKFPETYPNKDIRRNIKSDLMRHVVLNPDFTNFITKSVQLTNMYVMVKKPKGDVATWICPTSNYKIPARAPLVEIELLCDSPKCVNTQINYLTQQMSDSKSQISDSQQSGKSYLATQKRRYQEENSILDEIKTLMSALFIGSENHTNWPSKSDNGNNILQGLAEKMHMHDASSSHDETACVPYITASGTVNADEKSNYEVSEKEQVLCKTDKEKQMEEAVSLDNELIWYISSEYLPCFKEPAVRRCPTNKRMKC